MKDKKPVLFAGIGTSFAGGKNGSEISNIGSKVNWNSKQRNIIHVYKSDLTSHSISQKNRVEIVVIVNQDITV